jgi:NADP-dependent 3-hydroxy acid dehydrogenase YdfG
MLWVDLRMESLKNHVAVVTGASSGIRKTLALSLAAQGTEVWLGGWRKEVLEEVAMQALGSRGHACSLDLTCDYDVRNLGEKLEREANRLNILVLCGGTIVHGPLAEFSLADLD